MKSFLTLLILLLPTASSFGVLSMTASPKAGGSTVSPAVQIPPAKNIVQNRAVPGLKQGMDYIRLGTSSLVVSKVCMGTMTFGEQNTISEGVEQLHRAFDHFGVNCIDTAEMYPGENHVQCMDFCLSLYRACE